MMEGGRGAEEVAPEVLEAAPNDAYTELGGVTPMAVDEEEPKLTFKLRRSEAYAAVLPTDHGTTRTGGRARAAGWGKVERSITSPRSHIHSVAKLMTGVAAAAGAGGGAGTRGAEEVAPDVVEAAPDDANTELG